MEFIKVYTSIGERIIRLEKIIDIEFIDKEKKIKICLASLNPLFEFETIIVTYDTEEEYDEKKDYYYKKLCKRTI